MIEPYRILTTPIRLAGRPPLAQLATFVAADALVRRARATGRPSEWAAAGMSGDLAGQHAVERELAREGHDRESFGREPFVDRVRQMESECRAVVVGHLAALGIDADLAAGGMDDEVVAVAARTAFVRLFEEGLLDQATRVVATCPRCETVVEGADAELAEVDGERLHVRFAGDGGGPDVVVATHAVELLSGVLAVVVAEGHPAAGARVRSPFDGRVLPVVAEPGVEEPELVVPAHDSAALERSRRLGLVPEEVLTPEGIVSAAGPLQGLGRFAARAAAAELLQSTDGAVVAVDEVPEPTFRCRRCRTVLVPSLGRHWFLRRADLEVAVADAVRAGRLTFSPPSCLEDLLSAAGTVGDWCLSHQVWAGLPVPAATCLDCGRTDVSVERSGTCGKCMGSLEADDAVLDARFVAAVWALAAAGWPGDVDGVGQQAPVTTAVVGPLHLLTWVLPAAALGLRLAGAVPFGHVAVQAGAGLADEAGTDEAELPQLVESEGAAVVRAALAGGLDLDAARNVVAGLSAPAEGEADIDGVVESCEAAFAAGSPSLVVALVAAAAAEGVRPGAADRLRALADPILGT